MALRVQKRGSSQSQRALSSGEHPARPVRPVTDFEPTTESIKPALLKKLQAMAPDSEDITAIDVRLEHETQTKPTEQMLQVLHEELNEPTNTKPTPTIPPPSSPPPRLDATEETATVELEEERRESTLVMPSAPPRPPPGSIPAPSPSMGKARRVRVVRTVLALVWVGIVAVTFLALRTRRELKTAHLVATQAVKLGATTEPTAPPATAAPAAPAANDDPAAQATEPAPAASDGPTEATAEQGVIVTQQTPPGRRVWIDEHLMPDQTPESFTVRCGKHRLRIGSAGKGQIIDVPCGGEAVVVMKYAEGK
jgi:hypothetical protein